MNLVFQMNTKSRALLIPHMAGSFLRMAMVQTLGWTLFVDLQRLVPFVMMLRSCTTRYGLPFITQFLAYHSCRKRILTVTSASPRKRRSRYLSRSWVATIWRYPSLCHPCPRLCVLAQSTSTTSGTSPGCLPWSSRGIAR